MSIVGQRPISEVVEAFIDAAVDHTKWNTAMDVVARCYGSYGAILLPERARFSNFPSSEILTPVNEAYLRDGWAVRDERDSSVAIMERRGVAVDFDCTSPDRMMRSAYYREFLEPFGLRWFAGLQVQSGGEHWGCLSVQRTIDQGPFSTEEIEGLGALSRSLRGAFVLAEALGETRADAALASFELSGKGVLLVDRRGNIYRHNRAAEQSFDRDFQITSGRIASLDREAVRALELALHQLILAPGKAPMPAIVFRRPNRQPLIVYPLKLSAVSGDALASCQAAIMLVDPEANAGADSAVLQAAFGLTPAETRLALSLAGGMSLKQAAADLMVSHETVRTQLRGIFDKTGVHGQPQLVALLSRLNNPASSQR